MKEKNRSDRVKELPDQDALSGYKLWFSNAVQAENKWRSAAREDVAFYGGDQWDSNTKEKLREAKRPAITINKIRPLLNLLSGYQRLNRYDPDFLPRTSGDLEKVKIAQAVTSYLFDTLDYDEVESRVALDSWITGRGWFSAGWRWDWESLEGDIDIRRTSPFDIYIDPECREADLSDANYLCHSRWVTAEKVALQFPEARDQIMGDLGKAAEEEDWAGLEPLWYDSERKKVRAVNIWYRKHELATYLITSAGEMIPKEGAPKIAHQVAIDERTVSRSQMRVATFVGSVLLEDVASPYRHSMFPFVMLPSYWLGEGDIPAGVVRDLKDPQREMNKRRSQLLDFVNKMVTRGWFVKEGDMSDEQIRHLEKHGSEPGFVGRYTNVKPDAFDLGQMPEGFFGLDRLSDDDMHKISGINEAMMGVGAASQSGRAKEMDQRQAVVSITMLFDQMRSSKKRLLKQLWGKPNCPGLVPQYYKEPRVFRITQDDGQPGFVEVNQQQQGFDPATGQAVNQVLNDLSTFQFDVIVSDTPATPSQRVAAFYALMEMAKIGIPVPPDMILEASDIPQKEQLKQRMAAAQQPQPQQQGGSSGMPQQRQLPSGQPGAPPMPQQAPRQGPSQAQIQALLGQMRG